MAPPKGVKKAEAAASKELCSAVYAACSAQAIDNLLTQDDFLSLNVIPEGDLELLTMCLNTLTKEGLLKLMTKEGKPCWKVIKKEDAQR